MGPEARGGECALSSSTAAVSEPAARSLASLVSAQPHGREGSPIAQMLGNGKFPDALFSLEESKLLRSMFGFGPPEQGQK